MYRLIPYLLFLAPALGSASILETTDNKALFDLQTHKQESNASYVDQDVEKASLLNLNTLTNQWYLLRLEEKGGKVTLFNLLATDPALQVNLASDKPRLNISGAGDEVNCDLGGDILEQYRNRKHPKLSYLAVCKDRLFVVIKQNGYQPAIEKGAEVLRWLAGDVGESIINQVKSTVFADKFLVTEESEQAKETAPATASEGQGVPPRAQVDEKYERSTLSTSQLGLVTQGEEKSLLAGQWYPLKNFPSVFASLIEPGMVSKEILQSFRDRVGGLDGVENNGVVYLMGFSLSKYSMGWGHGTDHPGVGWSERAVNIVKSNPKGPDGFDTLSPLLTIGHVPPYMWSRTIGTISGGFQNRHAAFRWGALSKEKNALQYGFMENGVLMNSPSEKLATLLMYQDGKVDLIEWKAEDAAKLDQIRHMRQNGLPLLYPDENGQTVPSKWVKHWGAGNWSGSAEKQLRTPRGGLCLLETPEDRYIVYGYFSGVTPSGMARVFQAYGCKAAMQLDLNSPGQAYASLFRNTGDVDGFDTEHLQSTMYQYMGGVKGSPRFFVKPDYKDFLYIIKKD